MSSSVFMQSMEVIQTRIRALSLTDIPSANVLIQKVPRDLAEDLPATTPFPCILIAPVGAETLDPRAGTNLSHDIVYPINIVMLDADQSNQTLHFDRNLYWREQIVRKLHHCNMGLTMVRNCTITPGTIVDPGGWTRGKFIGGLRAMVTSRERRIA